VPPVRVENVRGSGSHSGLRQEEEKGVKESEASGRLNPFGQKNKGVFFGRRAHENLTIMVGGGIQDSAWGRRGETVGKKLLGKKEKEDPPKGKTSKKEKGQKAPAKSR